MPQTPERKKEYRTSPAGRAAKARYQKSEKGLAAQRRTERKYWASDRGKEVKRRKNARAFVKFKKALASRIECLRHTSLAFREDRIHEILNWAGPSHSYWVETEIQHACA